MSATENSNNPNEVIPPAASTLPYAGLRVVEFTHMVMGPTCGMVLADLGAEVIKVEPIGHGRKGDATRELLGSGAGFPGLIIALLTDYNVTLVESRARRIDYLQRAVEMLDLTHRVHVAGVALERLETAPYSVISARAFAPLPKLFDLAERFATNKTLWLLPKGRNADHEWQDAQGVWDGNFQVMKSITDQDAGILVGTLSGHRQIKAVAEKQGQRP